MGYAAAKLLLPIQLKENKFKCSHEDLNKSSAFVFSKPSRGKKCTYTFARLFGPSTFEASKLNVLFLDIDEDKHPAKLPRTYTLTHSDITCKITLGISNTINKAQLQGWYNRLQRDEVVAEWKKVRGKMSLHVHCHISGHHFLLDFIANLRYYIFCKELPVVLKAFVHGDGNMLNSHPELQEAMVWVYFHSNLSQFNKLECWGPLKDAASIGRPSNAEDSTFVSSEYSPEDWPQSCTVKCDCCFPRNSLRTRPYDFHEEQ